MDDKATRISRRKVVTVAVGGGLVAGATMAIDQPGSDLRSRSDGTPAASSMTVEETVQIRAVGLRFEPARIVIPAGLTTQLLLTNESATIHDLVIPSLARRTRRLRPGETGELTLNLDPGIYPFNCSIQSHWQAGMQGEIVVEAPVPLVVSSEADASPTEE